MNTAALAFSPLAVQAAPIQSTPIQHTSLNTRGCYLLGVSFDQRKRRYRARCHINGKRIHLGYFDNPWQAHKAWQEAKVSALQATLQNYLEQPLVHSAVVRTLLTGIATLNADLSACRDTVSLSA
ncbi:hypothetical protein [Pseudomonas sp. LFM046]|uniref:hypothetical protein n=1 Tax=Pseudomonas sp. LFM046 TaxID=1608357 RepID=UPI000AD58FA5|nr:hypothetical protein [Pseudomonas sp. LFM046]